MSVFQGALPVSRAERHDAPDLTTLTVAQLKALAAERGVEVPSRATKSKLIELLGG